MTLVFVVFIYRFYSFLKSDKSVLVFLLFLNVSTSIFFSRFELLKMEFSQLSGTLSKQCPPFDCSIILGCLETTV